ncbi:ABC transporter permease [Chloroflexota bacterium]
MNWSVITPLVRKDFSLFFRNRFFGIVTVLGLVFYLLIYFVMPKAVDENLEIGLFAPEAFPAFEQVEAEGLVIASVESDEALQEAVINGDYVAGIVLPEDMIEALISGQKPEITIYLASDVPEEIRDSVVVIIKELTYQQAGQPLNLVISEEILGPDMMGMQVPPRDRMRPLLAVFLIIFETFGLANLIMEEVERGTVRALLVTPMTVKDLFAAKGIVGIGLAFIQGVFFMTIVGGMNHHPLIILLALLLGSVMATAVGFLMAAIGKDFMTVLACGMIAMIILAIPAFGVMFPGAVTSWIKIIPSYYLVDTVYQVSSFGAGWGDIWQNLLILAGFNIALVWIGILGIRRKIA